MIFAEQQACAYCDKWIPSAVTDIQICKHCQNIRLKKLLAVMRQLIGARGPGRPPLPRGLLDAMEECKNIKTTLSPGEAKKLVDGKSYSTK